MQVSQSNISTVSQQTVPSHHIQMIANEKFLFTDKEN